MVCENDFPPNRKLDDRTAIKCNPDEEVIRMLESLGTGFDCASKGEMQQALDLGVDPQRIIFANTCKSKSDICYARKHRISRMTFDGADELYKLKAIFPEAELLLRISTQDATSRNPLSHKFGASLDSTESLCQVAKSLDLKLIGLSFHVGSDCADPQVFYDSIKQSREIFNQAKVHGHHFTVLDIGGGFATTSFDIMAKTITPALDEYFPDNVEIIAEPGRYFVESAFTIACNVIARRSVPATDGSLTYMLYLNDGVYSNFLDTVLSGWRREPRVLRSAKTPHPGGTPIRYSIWGRTCCGIDQIADQIFLPQLVDTGDWLYFENMGAYSSCLSSRFNGYTSEHVVHYACSEAEASALLRN